jgi:Flp pilus assembly protein TadB
MAEEVRVSDPQAEAAGEAIHLPGPSYQPALVAFGATLAVIGVVLSPILVAIGLVIIVVTLFRWIRDTRSEISELPLEH